MLQTYLGNKHDVLNILTHWTCLHIVGNWRGQVVGPLKKTYNTRCFAFYQYLSIKILNLHIFFRMFWWWLSNNILDANEWNLCWYLGPFLLTVSHIWGQRKSRLSQGKQRLTPIYNQPHLSRVGGKFTRINTSIHHCGAWSYWNVQCYV